MRLCLGLAEEKERLRRYVRILQLLAETDNQLNMNGIWRQLEGKGFGSEPTILYAIKDLQKWGMVKRIKTTKVRPGKHLFSYYALTPLGVEDLISSGVVRTGSVHFKTAGFLLRKYRDLLPYATNIADLWPLFSEAKVEDIAIRRLAIFIEYFHGEQLWNHVRGATGPVLSGEHEMWNWIGDQLRKKGVEYSVQCTADDDVEEFLDPFSTHYRVDTSFRNANDELERWNAAIANNEVLQTIAVRSTLKKAWKAMRSNNDVLRELSVKSVTLRVSDARIYRELIAEVEFLRSKIITLSS